MTPIFNDKYDSIFTAAFTTPHTSDRPTYLSADSITNQLDKIEERFAKSALAIVSNQADAFVKKLIGAKPEAIKEAKWDVVAPLQQLLYSFWREGWDLGQQHGNGGSRQEGKFNHSPSSSIANFENRDKVVQTDVTITKQDRRIKASKMLGNQAAYVSDGGIPLQQSGLQQALSDRTLKLASDLDQTTQKEIKAALIARSTPQPKTGKPISNNELEARINLALGRQKRRTGEEVRTKIPKIGGGFFSRAKLIARTEMTAAYATSSIASYQAAGVTHVRWLSLEDLQRCPKCTSRHGMVVALADVQTIATNPIPLHPNCFPAGTQILMSDGKTKAIENICSQDKVYTATAARVQSVYNTFKSKISSSLLKFTLEDGRTIESTPEHPFWNGSCFVAASTIQTGQSLWLSAYLGKNSSSSFNLLASDSENSNWCSGKQDWYAKKSINQSTQNNRNSPYRKRRIFANSSKSRVLRNSWTSNYQNVCRRPNGNWSDSQKTINQQRQNPQVLNLERYTSETRLRGCSLSVEARRRYKIGSCIDFRKTDISHNKALTSNRSTESKNFRADETQKSCSQSQSSCQDLSNKKAHGFKSQGEKESKLRQELQKLTRAYLSGRLPRGFGRDLFSFILGSEFCQDTQLFGTALGIRNQEIRASWGNDLLSRFLLTSTKSLCRTQRQMDLFIKNEVRPIQTNIPRNQNSFNRTKEVWHTPASFQGLTPLRVIKIEQTPFEGFVYNFSVENDEVYVANGILVHNCRCTWQPIPNGGAGDKLRKDPNRNPSNMGMVTVAASWMLGKALTTAATVTIANAQVESEKIKQKKAQQQKFLGKLLVGSGLGALSLTALYFLILKNKSDVSQKITDISNQASNSATNKVTDISTDISKSAINKVDEILGSVVEKKANEIVNAQRNKKGEAQKEASTLKAENESSTSNTPENVLSEATLSSFPALAQSKVNLKNISLKELMRLTGLSVESAKTFKEEILEWIRQKEIARRTSAITPTQVTNSLPSVQGLDIANASIPQLQQIFGLSKPVATAVRAYIEAGGKIESFEDLRNIPGIGDRTIAKIAARMSQYRPNINAVPNTIAAVNELSAQLNVGKKVVQAILDERDAGGHFESMADLNKRVQARLKNLPSDRGRIYLGKTSLKNIATNADVISLQQNATKNIQQVRVGTQIDVKNNAAPSLMGSTSSSSSKPTPATESTPVIPPLTPSILKPEKATASPITSRSNNALPAVNAPRGATPLSNTPAQKQKFTPLDAEYERLVNKVDDHHRTVRGSIPAKIRQAQKITEERASRTAAAANKNYVDLIETQRLAADASNKIEAEIENLEKSYGQFLNPANEPYFDNAPSAIKRTEKAISQTIGSLESQSNKQSRSLEEINNRIQELQKLQQDVSLSINRPNLDDSKNAISTKLDDLNQRISILNDSPQSSELQRQINILQSELTLERDRTLQNINSQIKELERLSNNLNEEAGGVKAIIDSSKARLEELRSRLSRLPKSPKQLNEAAQARYARVKSAAANQTKIRSQVSAYRSSTQQHVSSINEAANNQLKAIADYELQSRSAANNLSAIVQSSQSRIDQDMQLLRLMSGSEGIRWVLEQVQTGTEAGLILQNINKGSGVRSIKTMEEAAKFREYAMSTLHAKILGQSQLLQERLEYPTTLTQKFLDEASTTSADLNDLQKSITVKHQDDSAALIKDLQRWEENSATVTPGGAVLVNPNIRNAKNQIVDEITQTRKANSQSISEVIADQENWKSALNKKLNEDVTIEINGRATTRQQLLEELKLADEEAIRLRSMRQVDINPDSTPESKLKANKAAINRAQIKEMRSEISFLQSELGKVTLEINKRLEAKAQGRKLSPTGRLEADAKKLQEQINNLLIQINELNQNRNFAIKGNNTEVHFQALPCQRDRKKIIYPTSRLPRSEFVMPNLKRMSLGLL